MKIPVELSWMIIVAGFFLLFLPLDVNETRRSLAALWDLGHLVFFFCMVGLWLPRLCWRKEQVSSRLGIGLALLFGLAFGGLIEFLQQGVYGRDVSLGDVYLDVTGALLAAGWTQWRANASKTACMKGVRIIALLMVLPMGIRFMMALADEWRASRDFPVLLDSGDRLSLSRFGDRDNVSSIASGIQVAFSTTRYSGFGLRYFPSDWTGYARLELTIDNPSSRTIPLTCRIHDHSHNQDYADRFNGRYAIFPGGNLIGVNLVTAVALPSGRTMDLGHIDGLGCFTTKLAHPAVLILRRIRLVAS